MSSGPQHYADAESLLEAADQYDAGDPGIANVLAEAQVHATLSLAAATALKSDDTVAAWEQVLS